MTMTRPTSMAPQALQVQPPLQPTQPGSARSSLPAWAWLLIALAYYLVGCLMHLQFSLWLVRQRDTLFGHQSYSDLMPVLASVFAVIVGVGIIRQVWRSPQSAVSLGYWLLWLLSFGLIDLYLTYSMNEYFHYPQYAFLAWLLAKTIDPDRSRWAVGRVLFWTTLLGIGDELLQYLWITTIYSDYMDFNDFLTNLVAAAAGMLLYYVPAPSRSKHTLVVRPKLEWGVSAVLATLVLAGFLSGHLVQTPADKIPPGGISQRADGQWQLFMQRGPDFYGSMQKGPRHGAYHVLRPLPAVLIMAVTALAFASYAAARTQRPRRRTQMADAPAQASASGSGGN